MAQLKKSHFPIKGFPISSGFVSKVVSSQFTTYLCIAATICLFKWPSNTCLKIEASRHATCYLSIGLKSFLTHLLDEKYNLFHSLSSLWWQIFLFSLLAFFLHFAIFSLPCHLQSGTRCGWSILPPLLNFFNFPHTRSGEAPGSRICPLHPDLLSDVLQANLPRGVDDLGGWSHRYLLGENFTNHFLHVMARFFYNRCCTQSDQIELYLKEVLGNKFSYKSSQKIWWFSKTSLWREMVMVTFLLWSPWMHFFH